MGRTYNEGLTDGLTAIGNALGLEGTFLNEFGFNQIMAILKPEPEMEVVGVERWLCPICNTAYESIGIDRCCDPSAALIKLTGTTTRPKPTPVEKSAKISLYPDGGWCWLSGDVATDSPTTGVIVWEEPAHD
jgi:hypothetical protein